MNKLGLVVVLMAAIFLSGCSLFDRKTKAGLQVITSDVPSTIFLNGQYLEKTPLIERSIKPGEYTIRIQPDDPSLVPHETTVTLRQGLLTVVTWKPGKRPETSGGVIYEMEPLKNKNEAEVSFVSIPDGAIVSLQGKNKEFAPVIVSKVEPGAKEFEITLPSYETQRHTLNVVNGYRMIVKVKLAKLEAGETTPGPTPDPSVGPVQSPSQTTSPLSASASAQIKILPTNYFQNDQEVLKVRSSPGQAGTEIGAAVVGQSYPYLGETTSNWHKITFNNQEGWVSGEFSQITQE